MKYFHGKQKVKLKKKLSLLKREYFIDKHPATFLEIEEIHELLYHSSIYNTLFYEKIRKNRKNKKMLAKNFISLFVHNEIPDELIEDYLNDEDGEGTANLQAWIIYNMKPSISDWCTGIGVIESFELCYNSAIENGNI